MAHVISKLSAVNNRCAGAVTCRPYEYVMSSPRGIPRGLPTHGFAGTCLGISHAVTCAETEAGIQENCPLLLSDINQKLKVVTIFSKFLQHQKLMAHKLLHVH